MKNKTYIKWKKQNPELVKGLIYDAKVGDHYWLQIYETGIQSLPFESGFYGISAYGVYELMGRDLCKTLEEAKKHAQEEWADFLDNSPLYHKYG